MIPGQVLPLLKEAYFKKKLWSYDIDLNYSLKIRKETEIINKYFYHHM